MTESEKYDKVFSLLKANTIEEYKLQQAKKAMESTTWQADLGHNCVHVTQEKAIECIDAALVGCLLYELDLECALEYGTELDHWIE